MAFRKVKDICAAAAKCEGVLLKNPVVDDLRKNSFPWSVQHVDVVRHGETATYDWVVLFGYRLTDIE